MKSPLALSAALFVGSLTLLFSGKTSAAPTFNGDQPGWLPGETAQQHDARMAWWREAKFGMFIHWGIYSIPADGEWHMRVNKEPYAEYSKLAAQFNPTKFDADAWTSLAHDAGMKYMVLTTKHHDGFAMFKSSASPYNVVDATPFKRDVVKELSEAAPHHDIRFCTYYSFLADWGHPGGEAGCAHWDPYQNGDTRAYVKNIALVHLKELLTHYGTINVVWFDTDGSRDITPDESAQVIDILKTQPNIIVDPRLPGVKGDFKTAEQHMPLLRPKGDWELCGTVNGSWGYTHATAKPLEKLLPYMVTAWGMGGNVLMNVGPTPEGIIPDDSAERLRQVGAWLKLNGESIYGSTSGPFTYLPWGTATRKGDTLYLHVFVWPTDGVLHVPLTNAVTKAWFLTDAGQKPLTFDKQGGRVLVHLPKDAPDPIDTVIALKLVGEPATDYLSLALNKFVTASSGQNSAKNAVDDDGETSWRPTDHAASIEIDLGKPSTFGILRMGVVGDLKSATLEYKKDDQWVPLIQDKPLQHDENVINFPPVTAQFVRFSYRDQPNPPQIKVLELYPEL
jgi:alpha-L-fucosidase